MRCKENPVRFCPVIDRSDFIAGLLIGIVVGICLGWAIPVLDRKAVISSVLIGLIAGAPLGLLLTWLVAYLVVKLKS